MLCYDGVAKPKNDRSAATATRRPRRAEARRAQQSNNGYSMNSSKNSYSINSIVIIAPRTRGGGPGNVPPFF